MLAKAYLSAANALPERVAYCRNDFFSTHHYLPDEYKQMFENVNFVGLLQPSEFIYTGTALAVQHYVVILFTKTDKKQVFIHEQPTICFSQSIN